MKHITLHVLKNSEEFQTYLKYISDRIEIIEYDDTLSLLVNGDETNIPVLDYQSLKNCRLPLIDYLTDSQNRILYIHSETPIIIEDDLKDFGLLDFFYNKQIIIVAGGDWDSGLWINIDNTLYPQASIPYNNRISNEFFEEIYNKKQKPYKFNCLNNIERHHRNVLIKELKKNFNHKKN